MRPDGLDTPVQYLRGVGPARARLLARLGIQSVRDLLGHFPRAYQDRRKITPIADLPEDEEVNLHAEVRSLRSHRARSGVDLTEAVLADVTGEVSAVWFRAPHVSRVLKVGTRAWFAGRTRVYRGGISLSHPEFELRTEGDDPLNTGRVVPVYPLTAGLTDGFLRRLVWNALERWTDAVPEIFDDALRARRDLPSVHEAIREVHFPGDGDACARAVRRFKYEELFLLETAVAWKRRMRRERTGRRLILTPTLDERIRRLFPFRFTAGQEEVLREVVADLASDRPMNRMVQGEVGSGKTAVAVYAVLVAVANRAQAVIMAPTELLAEQHFRTLSGLLERGRVRTVLLSGGMRKVARREAVAQIETGEIDLVVGTHAVLEEDIGFKDLAVVVLDEQHRFGVLQRAALAAKGRHPHVLVMTATPIPRTLTLTVFGDVECSTIRGLPPGRSPVTTRRLPASREAAAWREVRREVQAGRQAYVVFPLIDASEDEDLGSAVAGHERIARFLPEARVGLLHGRLGPREKTEAMEGFRDGRIQVLVTTVVVEVGIDVPNATLIVVMHAERFGLAQLHQLRGRIGRGREASTCLLMDGARSAEARRRLGILETTTDGFRVAEEDLRIRGPGEIFGTRQHGLPELRIASLIDDGDVLDLARQDAFALVEEDPDLHGPGGRRIAEAVQARFREGLELIRVG